MGLTSTQSYPFKLVADGVQLDLFKNEDVFLSDNVTGLFDLGVLPSDFTRQITVPGTKKNNAFFEHVYDISVYSPDLFATNQKVECYLDFDGIYLSQGYLQLNKVNVLANKFIDSYEISIYGAISSFAIDINRSFLTDLTSSLAQYNHTASITNITSSWENGLFNGTIVYPMAEYGQKLVYNALGNDFGIDDTSGSLTVQDYKPSIRVKAVWDAIFDTYGYTYSGSFMQEPFLNNVYMVLNNQLRYPIVNGASIEDFGTFKMAPISGATDTQLLLTPLALPWYSILSNPSSSLSNSLEYTLSANSRLRGEIKTEIKVVADTVFTGNAVPQFDLVIKTTGGTTVSTIPLTEFNNFFIRVRNANITQGLNTATQTYTLSQEFVSDFINTGTYKFYIQYSKLGTNGLLDVYLDPNGSLNSYLAVTKVMNAADGKIIDIGKNMPFGTNGIKQIDFIKGIQKKFNLIIYPSKTKRNEFIVETFNNWYKAGEIKNFDKYINLDKKLEIIPANNLAVNELNFGDTLDQDYVSQQFSKLANRPFGKQFYVDTQNYFSQGKFEVETTFASSPLVQLSGTGISGSSASPTTNNTVSVSDSTTNTDYLDCNGTLYQYQENTTECALLNQYGYPAINYGTPISVVVRYNRSGVCNGYTPQDILITIPYGSTVGTRTYLSSYYEDCGAGCSPQSETINCVVSVSGQTGITLNGSSPISAC